jgi:uncharacterized protein YcaQ
VTPDSLRTARRFILGRQGLWPGRRWAGPGAVDEAIRYLGGVQVDPLDVIGHSQDLVLWGRIDGYRTTELEDALYHRRSVFEWGGNLQIRSIEELPYLRMVMKRKIEEPRWRLFAKSNVVRIAEILREVQKRGPLGGRDFEGTSTSKPGSFRGGKEATQVLYYLWLRGDLMVESRRRGEKVYDLTARLFPRSTASVSVEESEERLILQTLRHLGLASASEWLRYARARIGRSSLGPEWKDRVGRWQKSGLIHEVEVESWSGTRWLLTEALTELEALRSDRIPPSWRGTSTTTEEEAVFLSPLETATSRGRSTDLFGFELLCEFYKPAAKRRWGYYTLPILYREGLAARIDLRLDKPTGSIQVLGFWPDDTTVRKDRAFATALGRAFSRLAEFHGVKDVDLGALRSPAMERQVRVAFRAGH